MKVPTGIDHLRDPLSLESYMPTLLEAITNLVGQNVPNGQFLKKDSTRAEGLSWGLPIATDNDLDHTAQKLGLISVPFDPYAVNHTDLGLSPGYAIGMLQRPGNAIATNLGLWLAAAGTGSSGENKMFVMDETFKVLGLTADISTDLADNGNNGKYIEWPIVGGPINTVKGSNYFVGVLSHMSVNPTVGGILDGGGVSVPKFKSHFPGVEFSSISNVPAVNSSFTAGSAVLTPAVYFLAMS